MTATITGATEKQAAFIARLLDQIGDPDLTAKTEQFVTDKRTASAAIDRLLAIASEKKDDEVPEGIHHNGTDYVKAQRSQTGNLYALVAIIDRVGPDDVRVDWEYAGRRGLNGLSADTLLDADHAAAFGHLTGRCVYCGTRLETQESVSVGYGPTCAKNNGLPWGNVDQDVLDARKQMAAAIA